MNIYDLGLSLINGVGIKNFYKIIEEFGSSEDVFRISEKEILSRLNKDYATKLITNRNAIDIKGLEERVDRFGLKFISVLDAEYPQRLKNISDPPPILFYNGELKFPEKSVSIVGTRMMTGYGRSAVRSIVQDLSREGFSITSGLASGIDAEAHKACLENDGHTIAVLGTNILNPKPVSNIRLHDEIIDKGGLVLSEQWIDNKPDSSHYAMRNRIIAGLTEATVVIEAPIRSGALITAHLAFDYNREVFALPGDIVRKSSQGTNRLIASNKATLITSAEDILNMLGINKKVEVTLDKNISIEENSLLELINLGTRSQEEIMNKFDIEPSKLIASLVNLEIKGYIYKDLMNNFYTK